MFSFRQSDFGRTNTPSPPPPPNKVPEADYAEADSTRLNYTNTIHISSKYPNIAC